MDESYSQDTQKFIIALYLSCAVIWTSVIYYMKLFQYRAWWVLLLPYITFLISICNVSNFTEELGTNMTKASYLSIGVVLMIPVINWVIAEMPEYTGILSGTFTIALCFSLLTFIDIWLPRNYTSLYYHFRSTFQVMSVTLLIFSLMMYYLHRKRKPT